MDRAGKPSRRLIVIGPLPPPVHGVTVSTSLVLENPLLRERFRVEHLDTSDHRSLANLGRWDVTNISLALRQVVRLLRRLKGPKGIVYLPLSQNSAGFIRDAFFIHAAALRGWKVATHLRGSEFGQFYREQRRPLRVLIRLALRRIDSLAVMGSSLVWLFDGLVPTERIAVVPNGTPDLRPQCATRDPDTVLFLSHLSRRKGIVEAVEAAVLVRRRHPTARFLFVGNWEDEELERELQESAQPLGDGIRFLPAATGSAKRALLLSASVLLFPPVLPEGHPRIVVEAMSAELPIVTTDRGAIAETVIDEETGYVLDDPHPEQLADRLLRLLRDRSLRDRMAKAARARYLAEFTQERADRRLTEWLERVAA